MVYDTGVDWGVKYSYSLTSSSFDNETILIGKSISLSREFSWVGSDYNNQVMIKFFYFYIFS